MRFSLHFGLICHIGMSSLSHWFIGLTGYYGVLSSLSGGHALRICSYFLGFSEMGSDFFSDLIFRVFVEGVDLVLPVGPSGVINLIHLSCI